MTDDELTYAKEAKRKRGANVVEQEFAQLKHRKDPPRNNKKTNQSAQPASKEQVEGSHPLLLQPPGGEENLPRKDQSAKRNKGEETLPTATSVENKTPSYNNSLDDLDYVPVSPEFSEDLISDLKTSDVNHYINSFIASNTESSTASVEVSTSPSYTTLQPATTAHMHSTMSILNTLPGGAHFREDGQGFGGLSCIPPIHPLPPQPSMPQLTGCEFQTNVLNTLTLVLSNQQFIINELKEIKQNISVPLAVCQEGGDISTLENVVDAQVETAPRVPLLTLDQLAELKEKQVNNSKTANSKAYLAVLIMNALTTKEQQIGRRVFGSKTKPSLESNIVQQIRNYFFMMYPCTGDNDETAVWKSCIEKMDNRLKKYDKS